MKCFYKEYEVEVAAVYKSSAGTGLTPTVEIYCVGVSNPYVLTTKECFKSARDAELHGAIMARKWIDANVRE